MALGERGGRSALDRLQLDALIGRRASGRLLLDDLSLEDRDTGSGELGRVSGRRRRRSQRKQWQRRSGVDVGDLNGGSQFPRPRRAWVAISEHRGTLASDWTCCWTALPFASAA